MQSAAAATKNQSPDPLVLRLERTFEASQEQLFNAFVQSEAVAQWFGPEGMRCEIHQWDAQVGGEYRLTMRSPKGDEHALAGEFTQIDPWRRLAYTWTWQGEGDRILESRQTLVTLEFNPRGDRTELVLVQTGLATADSTRAHEQGWCSSFNCLDSTLARVD